MPDEPAALAPEGSYELLDPAKVIPRNTRNAQPSAHLIASIRQFGVLQPVRVLRTPEGELHLQVGDRRRKACIKLGIPVPAIVLTATVDTPEDEINRIFEQWTENQERENFTAAERAGVVATLFDLGVPDRRIAGATGLSKPEIAAARKTAASPTARTLAAQYPLTLDQAAVVAEFDGTPEIAKRLAEVARDNAAQFTHAAQLARDEREETAMLAARTAELTAQGFTVSTERQHYENQIGYWAGTDRKQLTPETHKDCPGSTVVLHTTGYGDSRRVDETWYCTDPKDHGHKRFRSGQPEKTPEASAERSRVLESNKLWRSATTVRQQWLRDVLLARRELPAGAARFTARAIAAGENHMVNALMTAGGGRHKTARELLGGLEKDTYDYKTQVTTSPLVDSLAGISEQRAHMITLALIVGAHEDQAADTETWRRPSRAARQYLSALAGWGYTLSPIEQDVIDAASGTKTTVGDGAKLEGEADHG
jgi:ParB family transcriptional regulator, chromosome partitioning protein